VSGSSAAWLQALGSPDRGERRRAADQGRARLQRQPELRTALVELLDRGSRPQRLAAAWVLFQTDGPSPELVPALREALELPDADGRWAAVALLGQLGRALPGVAAALGSDAERSPSPLRRRMALYALRELAPDQPSTEALLCRALADPSAEVRRAALSCFASLNRPGAAALEQALRIAGSEGDPRLRCIAVAVLPALLREHPPARRAAAALVERLCDSAHPSLARAARRAGARLARLEESR
jgi:HEAT repeat protein